MIRPPRPPVQSLVTTRLSAETAEGSEAAPSAVRPPCPRGHRNQPPVDAARFPRERGQKARGETKQFLYPRMEGPNLGDVRTVLALRGSISRNESLVEPAAVPAVPASPKGLQGAPTPLESDFNFDARRLSRRESASPQSAPSDPPMVVFPRNATTFVVQWRRILPAAGRTRDMLARASQFPHFPTPPGEPLASSDRPHLAQVDCRNSVLMVPAFFAETGGGATRLSWGVGPSGGVGMMRLSHVAPRVLCDRCGRRTVEKRGPFRGL